MARTKQPPIRKQPTSEFVRRHNAQWVAATSGSNSEMSNKSNGVGVGVGVGMGVGKDKRDAAAKDVAAGVPQLIIAVAGIYASFLTWAFLQEKLTTTPYGDPTSPELFKFPVFLNTVQSVFAAAMGILYLRLSTPRGKPVPPVIAQRAMLGPLLLVALTSALASPFGYASLAHIDYVTFLLAKSCKLLPVMFLHVTIFRRRYPLYKYLVVVAVTVGVAVFTLHSIRGKGKKHDAGGGDEKNYGWGLLLLSVNLLFDGLTNSTQDHIFSTFKPYSGPQMMCANNMMATAVTATYLLVSPWLVSFGVGQWVGMDGSGASGELAAGLEFLAKYPAVWKDVLGFAACGAVGQIFIFYTLSAFSSVVLVTVTVTRKMATMILSVFAFGHHLTRMQWVGVGLVFGAIGVEATIQRKEKAAKEAAKTAALTQVSAERKKEL